MTIASICNRQVITIQRDASVLNATMLMRQFHVGEVVVVETKNGQFTPVGLVTDRDVVIKLVATELDMAAITVGDIMESKVTTIKECSGVFDTIQAMTSKGVRRLPVVDNSGGLVGIITLDDLLLLLAKELSSLSKLVSREQKNEASKRH